MTKDEMKVAFWLAVFITVAAVADWLDLGTVIAFGGAALLGAGAIAWHIDRRREEEDVRAIVRAEEQRHRVDQAMNYRPDWWDDELEAEFGHEDD